MRTVFVANAKAAALKHELFGLTNRFKDFASAVRNGATTDAKLEAHSQADQAACALAEILIRMENELDLFFDESRDSADQAFDFIVGTDGAT